MIANTYSSPRYIRVQWPRIGMINKCDMCGHRHVQYIIDQNLHDEDIQWIKISIEA